MCICAHTYVHMHACIHACMRAHVCVHTYALVHMRALRAYTCTCVSCTRAMRTLYARAARFSSSFEQKFARFPRIENEFFVFHIHALRAWDRNPTNRRLVSEALRVQALLMTRHSSSRSLLDVQVDVLGRRLDSFELDSSNVSGLS